MTEATRDENGTWRAISVGRALDVLNAFMGEDATLSMSELARLNDLPTTTMHRLVLQILQRRMPTDRWVLKSPVHLHNLGWSTSGCTKVLCFISYK